MPDENRTISWNMYTNYTPDDGQCQTQYWNNEKTTVTHLQKIILHARVCQKDSHRHLGALDIGRGVHKNFRIFIVNFKLLTY